MNQQHCRRQYLFLYIYIQMCILHHLIHTIHALISFEALFYHIPRSRQPRHPDEAVYGEDFMSSESLLGKWVDSQVVSW